MGKIVKSPLPHPNTCFPGGMQDHIILAKVSLLYHSLTFDFSINAILRSGFLKG